jgi:hypothetical protein
MIPHPPHKLRRTHKPVSLVCHPEPQHRRRSNKQRPLANNFTGYASALHTQTGFALSVQIYRAWHWIAPGVEGMPIVRWLLRPELASKSSLDIYWPYWPSKFWFDAGKCPSKWTRNSDEMSWSARRIPCDVSHLLAFQWGWFFRFFRGLNLKWWFFRGSEISFKKCAEIIFSGIHCELAV